MILKPAASRRYLFPRLVGLFPGKLDDSPVGSVGASKAFGLRGSFPGSLLGRRSPGVVLGPRRPSAFSDQPLWAPKQLMYAPKRFLWAPERIEIKKTKNK